MRIFRPALVSACASALALPASAARIEFTTAGPTGVAIDGAGSEGRTVPVAEVLGLTLTARTSDAGQALNAVSDSFGIGSGGRLENDESAVFSFNQDVSITRFDFIGFGAGDAFVISLDSGGGGGGSGVILVEEDELANRSSQTWDPTGSDAAALAVIPAGTLIGLTAGSAGSIGVQTIDVALVPEPAGLALLATGLPAVVRRRCAG